jgi:hypothetical protein
VPLLVLSPTRVASNRKTIKTTTALVGVITNKTHIDKQHRYIALVGVITNKTHIDKQHRYIALVGVITNKTRIKPQRPRIKTTMPHQYNNEQATMRRRKMGRRMTGVPVE